MNKNTLIGREKESAILKEALVSKGSELISVIGRRRVGKTFLVQSVYAEKINFEITGIQKASQKEQLENFPVQTLFQNKKTGIPDFHHHLWHSSQPIQLQSGR